MLVEAGQNQLDGAPRAAGVEDKRRGVLKVGSERGADDGHCPTMRNLAAARYQTILRAAMPV